MLIAPFPIFLFACRLCSPSVGASCSRLQVMPKGGWYGQMPEHISAHVIHVVRARIGCASDEDLGTSSRTCRAVSGAVAKGSITGPLYNVLQALACCVFRLMATYECGPNGRARGCNPAAKTSNWSGLRVPRRVVSLIVRCCLGTCTAARVEADVAERRKASEPRTYVVERVKHQPSGKDFLLLFDESSGFRWCSEESHLEEVHAYVALQIEGEIVRRVVHGATTELPRGVGSRPSPSQSRGRGSTGKQAPPLAPTGSAGAASAEDPTEDPPVAPGGTPVLCVPIRTSLGLPTVMAQPLPVPAVAAAMPAVAETTQTPCPIPDALAGALQSAGYNVLAAGPARGIHDRSRPVCSDVSVARDKDGVLDGICESSATVDLDGCDEVVDASSDDATELGEEAENAMLRDWMQAEHSHASSSNVDDGVGLESGFDEDSGVEDEEELHESDMDEDEEELVGELNDDDADLPDVLKAGRLRPAPSLHLWH